jgi:hypothetical protein
MNQIKCCMLIVVLWVMTTYKTTERHNPADHNYLHSHGYLKSQLNVTAFNENHNGSWQNASTIKTNTKS